MKVSLFDCTQKVFGVLYIISKDINKFYSFIIFSLLINAGNLLFNYFVLIFYLDIHLLPLRHYFLYNYLDLHLSDTPLKLPNLCIVSLLL